jgi:hypothetical protein
MCRYVCELFVLFVLFLLVMCICLDLQGLKSSGTLDLWPDLCKPSGPSQAKLAAREACRSIPSHVTERMWISLLLERGQDRLILSSPMDVLAAQVCAANIAR